MSAILANNVSVLSGTFHMELYGIPTYDIVIDQVDGSGFDAGTAVMISCDGGLTLKGTVADKRAGDFLDTIHVRIVGGKNGMGKTATAKGYMQPQALVKDVVGDLFNTAGETLSSDSDQTIQNTNLSAWMTTQRAVSECVDVLLEYAAPDAGWRILADGTVRIGKESWPSSNDEYVLMNHDPVEARFDLGVDVPTIVPGVNLNGVGQVAIVEHRITADATRSIVWVQVGVDRGFGESIRLLAKHALAKIDYFAFYACTVKAQSADLSTVDLNPPTDLPLIGGLQRVSLRHGLPGCKVKVPTNTNVMLGWDRGDPQFPFAALWTGGTDVTRLQLGGNTDAARKNDPISHGTIQITFTPATGTGVATGGALVVVYTPGDGSATQTITTAGTLTIDEKILSGSSIVGLG